MKNAVLFKKSATTFTGQKMYVRKAMLLCGILLLMGIQPVLSQIAAWNPAGLTGFGPSPWTATTAHADLTVGGLTRGAGVTTTGMAAGSAWGGNSFMGGATQDATFTLTANSGFNVSLSTFNLFYRRSGTGADSLSIDYAIGAGAYVNIDTIALPVSTSGGAAITPITLTGITALQNVAAGTVITIRMVPFGSSSTNGNFYIFSTGLSIDGTVNSATACTAPSGLTVTGVSPSGATIDWTPLSGITGYEYVLDMVATDPTGAGTPHSSSTYPAGGLMPATTYYFHVRTDCGGGNFSDWSTIFFTTDPAPICADPTGLAVSGITSAGADFNWDPETGITGFEYVLDMVATDPAGAGTPTTSTNHTASLLTPGTTYYFHLRVDCGSGDFSGWVTISFNTLPTCADPTGLSVSNISSSDADIDWDNVSGITGFEYVLNTSATAPTGAGTSTTLNFFSPAALTPGTTYYFHLRVNCGSGDFSGWVTVPFTTLTPCADPTGLASSNVTTNTADLDWDAVSGITGFEYVLNTTATAPTGAGTATTANSFNASSLTAGTTYYFHLRVDCGSGNFSDWVTISFTTLSVCTDPAGLAVSGITNTTANLNWTAVGGITGFEYVLNTTATDPTGAGTATTANSFNATALTAGTTYYFHLRKNCGSNFSDWVNINFTTTTVSVNELAGIQMAEVYPNPSTGMVNLKIAADYMAGQLTITDMTGKVLANVNTTNANTVIDLSAYEAQVYYFTYTSGDNRQVFKIVKQ